MFPSNFDCICVFCIVAMMFVCMFVWWSCSLTVFYIRIDGQMHFLCVTLKCNGSCPYQPADLYECIEMKLSRHSKCNLLHCLRHCISHNKQFRIQLSPCVRSSLSLSLFPMRFQCMRIAYFCYLAIITLFITVAVFLNVLCLTFWMHGIFVDGSNRNWNELKWDFHETITNYYWKEFEMYTLFLLHFA